MRTAIWIVLTSALIIPACKMQPLVNNHVVTSPDGQVGVEFSVDESGIPTYQVQFDGQDVIKPSTIGFDLFEKGEIGRNVKIVDHEQRQADEPWEMPWGEQRSVQNRFNELLLVLQEVGAPDLTFNIRFRVYDDGIGFRYEVPAQAGVDTLYIKDELTHFNLSGDHKVWWIPGDWDIYEHLYTTSLFSEIDALAKRDHPNLSATHIPHNAVNTPVTMRTNDGLHLSFHEANLTDYAGMTLLIDTNALSMQSGLVGSERAPYSVRRTAPFHTPWRTIQISEDAAGLIESKLILNLNEPNVLGDVSWFKPKKYVGIWWEMHLGISSWDMASGRHGATTANAKTYIDFAAENDIAGVLVEGWNTGWEHWIGFEDREGVFDFVTPYPDYDLDEVVRYAKSRGVEVIMHHETSAAPRTYAEQLDTAYRLMDRLGIRAVKTGYVGPIIPKGEYHHGQWMVNHYRHILETAARYNIAINAHEPIKATGIRRTYPNAISREGLRGQEFNAWSIEGGNPPEHLPIVAFTRMLAGPIDFTPGVFDMKLSLREGPNQINTTLAQQLALYVVIYSPIQMACDLPQFYEDQPAFQFIRDVAWIGSARLSSMEKLASI